MINYSEEIIELRNKNKTYNEICEILGCAKSTVSYHSRKNNLGGINNPKLPDCEISKMQLYYQNNTMKNTALKFNVSESTVKNYCKKGNRGGLTLEEKRKRRVIAVQKRRRKVKEMAITYLGGECNVCGYDKCVDALDFHHIDPDQKEFGISTKGYTRSWEKVKKELDKCLLVCANCHREIHSNRIKGRLL